jgi:hypothetical protein
MGIFWRTRKGEKILDDGPDGECVVRYGTTAEERPGLDRCSFCGGNASGYWRGHTDVSCCRECAVRILPQLCADALVGESGDHEKAIHHVLHYLDVMKAAFWRAMTSAVRRAAQVAAREQQAALSLAVERASAPEHADAPCSCGGTPDGNPIARRSRPRRRPAEPSPSSNETAYAQRYDP